MFCVKLGLSTVPHSRHTGLQVFIVYGLHSLCSGFLQHTLHEPRSLCATV